MAQGDGLEGLEGLGLEEIGDASLDLSEFGLDKDDDDRVTEEPISDELKQTDYGGGDWGAGAGYAYRPHGMSRTDQAPLGAAEEKEQVRNSNEAVDPLTLYDRTSYERGKTIGSGIFDMEESNEFRAGYGIFAHDYALPDYVAREGELSVAPSEMWDPMTGTFRVVQPSASGVQWMTQAPPGTVYSPFVPEVMATTKVRTVPHAPRPLPEYVMESPRSHLEAFGRRSARALITAGAQHGEAPVAAALEQMKKGSSGRVRRRVNGLVKHGYNPEMVLEAVITCHVVMAAWQDLEARHAGATNGASLPKIDRMAHALGPAKPAVAAAARDHLAPLLHSKEAFEADKQNLLTSPAGLALGQAESETSAPAVRPRGVGAGPLIALGIGLAAWLGYDYWKEWREGKR